MGRGRGVVFIHGRTVVVDSENTRSSQNKVLGAVEVFYYHELQS
jgi:hypothetical protein